tara:strand:- start:2025 stop:2261 length:237 start_codon:yes stop_codon:yes gene_type:complete
MMIVYNNWKRSLMENSKLNRIIGIIRSLREDAAVVGPTNNVGGGKIAGTVEAGDDPPVRRKKKRYIYQKGIRKLWKNG